MKSNYSSNRPRKAPPTAIPWACAVGFMLSCVLSTAAPPVVSNVKASQRAGAKLVDITYDVADPDSATLTVSVAISQDAGLSYNVPVSILTGDFGPGVKPGTGKKIVWNAGQDWGGESPNKAGCALRRRMRRATFRPAWCWSRRENS